MYVNSCVHFHISSNIWQQKNSVKINDFMLKYIDIRHFDLLFHESDITPEFDNLFTAQLVHNELDGMHSLKPKVHWKLFYDSN